jgi:predicted thioesterase
VLVKHLRPARIGAPLHVFAKLVRVKGPRVFARTEVHSRGRKIGEGSVLQVVLSRARFAKLIQETR